jgi:hypothetical protein
MVLAKTGGIRFTQQTGPVRYMVYCSYCTFYCSRWCYYRQGVSTNGVCTLYGVQQLRTTAIDGASTDRAFAHNTRCLYIVRCTADTYYGRIWYLYIVQAVSFHKTSGACTVHEYCIAYNKCRNHERTISLRFLGIILRVIRLENSVFNVYITNHFCSRGEKIC